MAEYITPHSLILLGGALTLIGAFWASQKDNKQEKELNEKNEIIISKTEENSKLSKRVSDILTGEGSYPYVSMSTNPGHVGGVAILSLKGDLAIENLSGSFLDIRAFRKHQKEKGFGIEFEKLNFSYNVLSPVLGQWLGKGAFNFESGGRYLVTMYTPYHKFLQHIAIEKSESAGYIQTYQIYKDDELIETSYPETFPIPLKDIDFLEELTPEEFEAAKKKGSRMIPFD